MKTKTGGLSAIIAAALLFGTLQTALAFYNPEIGRWANRDPIGELGGENLYTFASNRPTTAVDPDGALAIEFSVTYDDSIKDRTAAHKLLQVQINDLKARLQHCCKAFKIGCGCGVVTAVSGGSRKKPTGGYSTFPFTSPYKSSIPIIVTASPLEDGKTTIGRGLEGAGLVITGGDSRVLSHELGHVAGYKGDDPVDILHSKKKTNLMYKNAGPNQQVDEEWCKKVSGLAK